MRTPMAIIAVLIAVLVAIGLLTDGGAAPSPPPAAPVAVIAERVEAVRGVRFRSLPEPLTVTPEQARAEGLADLDRGYPAAEREADELLYELLGLVPEGTDLREISASLFGEQVAGYYDPRTGRLRVVAGMGGNRVVDEITLAHELTHALEDQVFDLDTGAAERTDDPGYAYRALVEGSATAVMLEYATRHFGAEEALGGLLSSAFSVTSTTPLPPFVQQGFVWPYLGGRTFVDALYRSGNRSWRLVDVALRSRPPSSTEQVLHPDKWLRVEEPQAVAFELGLRGDWRRRTAGVFGEWQTSQLVRDPAAAAGWGGDRYELWTRAEERALAMRWRWDTPADAREFAAALRAVDFPAGLHVTIVARPREVRLGLATAVSISDLLTR